MRGPSKKHARADGGGFVAATNGAAAAGKDVAALGAVILFGIAVVLWCGWGW